MSAKADIYKCMHFLNLSIWGRRAGERKDVLCNCPLSLSLLHSYSLKTWRSSPCLEKGHTRSKHENTKLPFKQKKRKKKKDKNGLLCFIHLGKQQKKNKHCADWYITDTNQPSHTIHTLSHSYTFIKKYSLL